MKHILSLLLIFGLNFSKAQEEKLNPKWIRTDSVNYETVLRVLKDTSLLKNKQDFFKKFTPFDARLSKDLGFDLTLIEGGQYGGYTTAWVNLLVYEEEIIKLEIRYNDEDTKTIDHLLKTDRYLLDKVKKLNKGGPYVFHYTNQAKYTAYKQHVAQSLGQTSQLSKTGSKEFNESFNILTNPLLNYDYGTRCYESGTEPQGRKAINYFISLNDSSTIREIMKQYNPEGRLYAVEALLKLSKSKAVALTNDDKKRMQLILSSKIPISSCQGCLVSKTTADKLIVPNNDFSEEERVIKEENKIRQEQGVPKRKGY